MSNKIIKLSNKNKRISMVENSEGAIFKLGDTVNSNANFEPLQKGKIIGFRYALTFKGAICAVFSEENPYGIRIDKLEINLNT